MGLTAYLSIELSSIELSCSFLSLWFTPKPLSLLLNHFNIFVTIHKNLST